MKVWITGRRDDGDWEVMGVYTDRGLAIARCRETIDFVGPVELDVDLPEETMHWPGLFHPLTDPDPEASDA